jgi:hypothetical protein
MEKLLSTHEMEVYIKEEYVSKLEAYLDKTIELVNIFFMEGYDNSPEGTYVYADEKGYNYLFTEKGEVRKHEITMEIFKIAYLIMGDVVFTVALEYATENRIPNRDFRRVLFEEEKRLWNELEKKGYEMKCMEIQEILRENPLVDG